MKKEEKYAKSIEVLNKARSMELKAIHLYMNQHYNLDDRDYGELAAKMKLIAIDEMRHAEAFAERIKELGGEPTSALIGKVTLGQETKVIHQFDIEEEETTIAAYNEFIKICRENNDMVTSRLFERIIDEEQIHLTYFENVQDHINTLKDSYLSKMAGTPSETGGPSKGFVSSKGE